MAKFWVVWIIMPWMLWATEAPLRFGAIATVSPKELEKRFEPLLHHLEAATGRRIVFESAPTYDRTIENFVEGRYDFGWIGPSPYVLATRKKPGSLRILGALAGPEGGMYEGVIIVRKDAPMHSLEALAGKRFAFGSTDSTLSYYVPKWMLYRAGVYGLLSEKIFMGRHDRVLKQVVMGKADAGGVKASVAETMGDHIRVIARSEPIPDFAVVCRADLDPDLQRRIETALLSLKDPAILEAIKAGSVGFIPRGPTEYHYLRRLMDEVEEIDRRQRN